MNIAKHMEAIFFVAVTLTCAATYATTTAPVINVNVSTSMASNAVDPSIPTIVVIGKRVS